MTLSRSPTPIAALVAVLAVLAAAGPALAQATKPATRPSSVAGKVSAAGGKALPEMIVYLEPTDPAARFPVSAEPVHVSQRDARFTPALVVVCVGQSVDFSNDEPRSVEHNVFS